MTVGRLAPSPTGALHVGNARTFLWAWLSARRDEGRVILRVEDLEKQSRGLVTEELLSDLAWLGLTWDEGPHWGTTEESLLKSGHPASLKDQGLTGPYIQSQRREFYQEIFTYLADRSLIYPCSCTKADYGVPLGAPHEGEGGLRYPGTCRSRSSHTPEAAPLVWRFKVPEGEIQFTDLLHGPQRFDIHRITGDFPVFRTPDQPYYQLAVVADDMAMGVTQVVRGDDLLESTARQILLYRALGGKIPQFGHTPLVVGPDGKRISKRHGDSRIRTFRLRGMSSRRLVGHLARWSGFDVPEEISAEELIPLWSWEGRPRTRLILTPEELALFR